MNDTPTLLIYAEQTFTVGQDTFIDSTAENNNAVVFEDNEETGYFYAVDRNDDLSILDALHVYNVADVILALVGLPQKQHAERRGWCFSPTAPLGVTL